MIEDFLVSTEGNQIPVIVITGFLGSGKTTLLQRLLVSPALRETAVLINEFGEIGLDHHFIQKTDENVVTLVNGCICCTIREDLSSAIRDLIRRWENNQIPRFERLIVETTGLADPVPIVHTLITEPGVMEYFELQSITTTVDAVNASDTLDKFPEAEKQVGLADRILITKQDLVETSVLETVINRVRRINPSADLSILPSTKLDPTVFITSDNYNFSKERGDVNSWINSEVFQDMFESSGEIVHGSSSKEVGTEAVTSFCLTFDNEMNWVAFGVWMTMLLHSRGEDVLRVKALIKVDDAQGPVVFHGVQHIVHPPIHLDSWPDDVKRSRIVFIVRGIAEKELQTSLLAFNSRISAIKLNKSAMIDIQETPMGAGLQVGGRPFLRRGAPSWLK